MCACMRTCVRGALVCPHRVSVGCLNEGPRAAQKLTVVLKYFWIRRLSLEALELQFINLRAFPSGSFTHLYSVLQQLWRIVAKDLVCFCALALWRINTQQWYQQTRHPSSSLIRTLMGVGPNLDVVQPLDSAVVRVWTRLVYSCFVSPPLYLFSQEISPFLFRLCVNT